MKVREVIEELKKFDQELECMVYSGIDEGGELVSSVGLCKNEGQCPYFKGDSPYACDELGPDEACVVIGDAAMIENSDEGDEDEDE